MCVSEGIPCLLPQPAPEAALFMQISPTRRGVDLVLLKHRDEGCCQRSQVPEEFKGGGWGSTFFMRKRGDAILTARAFRDLASLAVFH